MYKRAKCFVQEGEMLCTRGHVVCTGVLQVIMYKGVVVYKTAICYVRDGVRYAGDQGKS